MNDRYAPVLARLLVVALASALAAPAAALGGGGDEERALSPVARNDVAHFGRSTASERPSPDVLNDRAHFGDEPRAPTSATGQGPAPVVVRVGGGFDWVSAGVGAAGVLGVALVVVTGASALRRRQRVGAARA